MIQTQELAELRGRVNAIEDRLNGHVPEKCIREEEAVSNIKEQLKTMNETINRIWKRLDAPATMVQQALISAVTGGIVALLFVLLSKKL